MITKLIFHTISKQTAVVYNGQNIIEFYTVEISWILGMVKTLIFLDPVEILISLKQNQWEISIFHAISKQTAVVNKDQSIIDF